MTKALLLSQFTMAGSFLPWEELSPGGLFSLYAQKLLPYHPARSQSCPDASEQQHCTDNRLEKDSLLSPYWRAVSHGHRRCPTRAQSSGQGANTQSRIIILMFICFIGSAIPTTIREVLMEAIFF